ncbi:hypothetical protein [Rhizobium laguerreae]|uniref:hypothetical protein n=1 Tax=Rhizobium laguerreae TaxID=1076926 RepID=UPI001441DC49|nr:hypothetical protein [Rhizobium laguerreae]NKM69419.1 tyrosine-type recombinase/integrase [Rhizobium laguerreae]
MSIHYTEDAFTAFRNAILLDNDGVEGLSRYSWETLARIEIFPGSTLGAAQIVVPENYLPPGPRRRPSFRTRSPSRNGRITQGTSKTVGQKREEWVRRALLVIWLPHRLYVKKDGYGPSTWLSKSKIFLRVIEFLSTKLDSSEHDFWPLFLIADLQNYEGLTTSAAAKNDLRRTCEMLKDAAEIGIMPRPPETAGRQTGWQISKSFRSSGEVSPTVLVENSTVSTPSQDKRNQAFPNDFVVSFLNIAIWLQENLIDQLIECWEKTEAINNADPNSRGRLNESTKRARERIVYEFEWKDKNDRPLTRLPFNLKQSANSGFEYTDVWPPKNYATLPLCITVAQASNACLTGFCTGARIHEISGAESPSVEVDDGVMSSRTYKYAPSLGGEKRHWPLHPYARRALLQQDRLARIVRPADTLHLWVQTRHSSIAERGSALHDLSQATVECLDHLQLTDLSAGRPHYHRWRHTLARSIALTVVEAQQVIQDVLGHDDLETSLHYMLSDPEIAQWAMQIAREAAHALAVEAVKEIDKGVAGGPAATPLANGLAELKMRRGIEVLGIDDIEDAAKFLTVNGVAFQRIKGKIICTKLPNQFGPCTKTRGRPDPGACRSSCANRLELSIERIECELELARLLGAYEASKVGSNQFEVAYLSGAILAELYRWPSVREEFISKSSFASEIWHGRK